MLLLHQAGSVKIGEVIRYTLTYTPSHDRILPTPKYLHLKIKNTCAIPLRAAWLHGPYVLHVAAYPATFNPHVKVERDEEEKYGVPEYEPMLKAGGSWTAKLKVPEEIRETGAHHIGVNRPRTTDSSERKKGSVTWIIEITSQILFSTSASVNFEVLVGRDERSLDLGFAAVAGHGHGAPGQIKERQQSEKERTKARKQGNMQIAGVYSKAVRLIAEDTEALWDKPHLPSGDDEEKLRMSQDHHRVSNDVKRQSKDRERQDDGTPKKRKKVHLVILTHGLHSNIGADMLFLKESIDATVKQAKLEARKRKAAYRKKSRERRETQASGDQRDGKDGPKSTTATGKGDVTSGQNGDNDFAAATLSGGQEDFESDCNEFDGDDDEEEETIVRGYTGNAVRTENGIQYLGKRLAKYILRLTYPDQPFLPLKKPLTRTLTDTFKSEAGKARRDGVPAHSGSSIHSPKPSRNVEDIPYKFTSISFVGHSLGGLVQTYAIAYIHKHSPTFFQQIRPVNFVCMASPMLGLSNENPLYVKFALDFGLVGRTGQDLGLSWRPNTIARGGWNAMIGGLGSASSNHKSQKGKNRDGTEDPSAKPLLRILPTGPAHQVLKMFRNRTVYSNVVNDGIVPLRTSCLLFLDWRGLGKVEKARRENGLIGTVAEWGWAELTGANASSIQPNVIAERYGEEDDDDEHVRRGEGDVVPQPDEDETADDNRIVTRQLSYEGDYHSEATGRKSSSAPKSPSQPQEKGILDSLLGFFRPSVPDRSKSSSPQPSKKTTKALHRGQTIYQGEDEMSDDIARGEEGTTSNPTMHPHLVQDHTGQTEQPQQQRKRPAATKGDSFINDETGDLQAPPKTSIFESAGDILHPPLPSKQWITDPSSRARTIFHDRVYHPEDIPPPPAKRQGSRSSRHLSSDNTNFPRASQSSQGSNEEDRQYSGSMKVEEKIARAYHRDLSWRKVLVRLEPDAHNNIIVRRMFANAYGWPVIKHLCDTHFADTYTARTRDEEEPARERAQPMDVPVPKSGEEVKDQTAKTVPERTQSETREARDELADLIVAQSGAVSSYSSKAGSVTSPVSSSGWDESYLEGSDDDDSEVDERSLVQRIINPMSSSNARKVPRKPEKAYHRPGGGSRDDTAADSLPTSPVTDTHCGLGITVSTSPRTARSGAEPNQPTVGNANIGESHTPVVADSIVEEPEPMDTSLWSTANLGLRKNVLEQVQGVGAPMAIKSKGRQ
ncbi:hypothetical protein M433DRAFT_153184 [Acidomyces richmondensis BFW]|nr:MAG: hypothetical protein FE78DRAFT_88799 [Acidomyces sp. 'richmondensis']KYG46616.1 hypothetical protein M433DRAFT_153184 [Acidomyces richmondensis BFW]